MSLDLKINCNFIRFSYTYLQTCYTMEILLRYYVRTRRSSYLVRRWRGREGYLFEFDKISETKKPQENMPKTLCMENWKITLITNDFCCPEKPVVIFRKNLVRKKWFAPCFFHQIFTTKLYVFTDNTLPSFLRGVHGVFVAYARGCFT